MELIDQHTKEIMEGCKERAKNAGLNFGDETLEYIVTNRDLLELSPKVMIPTLYDYWVHDVEVLKEKGKYELYPGNPYETVINTHPAISFYNDNNPDWLNVMIFYHVLAHIDFFKNNLFFRHTWDYDFTAQALSDKRIIAKLRAKHGRWVDYVIEFTRGIDNLVGYYDEISDLNRLQSTFSKRLDFYFDVFLQELEGVNQVEYIKEIERYNGCIGENEDVDEKSFWLKIKGKYPEFDEFYKEFHKESIEEKSKQRMDLTQFLMEKSEFLNKRENKWMKTVMQIVRKTSIFLQPQIRTKIMNEGWACYWHEKLFLQDDRIKGNEVNFARVNSGVVSLPRVGLNPYAIGLRLFQFIEEMVDKGKHSFEFQRLKNVDERKKYDSGVNQGRDFIFKVRENYSDFMFVNGFVDQDFVDKNKLFVAGKRLNKRKRVWEYYVKSRKAKDYRQMLLDVLYHPPHIEIDLKKGKRAKALYLVHHFEERPLVKGYIKNTMIGIEYLWNSLVCLETSKIVLVPTPSSSKQQYRNLISSIYPGIKEDDKESEFKWQRVLYTMKDRKLSEKNLDKKKR